MDRTRSYLPCRKRMNDGINQLFQQILLTDTHRLCQQITIAAQSGYHGHVIAFNFLEIKGLFAFPGPDDRPHFKLRINLLADMCDSPASF
ncbi:hypothetical protein D3C75_1101090 [compost metagenome]